ncbi:hypothetical protein LZ31DRAFT_34350 [Colletotrichum somersetense]|nr:hypothetical protein LZ31DRAFT_34350 [Colletotrichum somersetense]
MFPGVSLRLVLLFCPSACVIDLVYGRPAHGSFLSRSTVQSDVVAPNWKAYAAPITKVDLDSQVCHRRKKSRRAISYYFPEYVKTRIRKGHLIHGSSVWTLVYIVSRYYPTTL